MKTLQTKQNLILKPKNLYMFIFFVLVLLTINLMPANEVLAENQTTPQEYLPLTFKQIKAFEYTDPDVEQVKSGVFPEQVPEEIKSLNNKKVSLNGFMVPMDLDEKGIISFILVSNQMECCFGLPEQMNGWVIATLDPDKRSSYYQDVLIDVRGIFEVGEIIDQYDNMSLYRIKVHSLQPPKGSKSSTLW